MKGKKMFIPHVGFILKAISLTIFLHLYQLQKPQEDLQIANAENVSVC